MSKKVAKGRGDQRNHEAVADRRASTERAIEKSWRKAATKKYGAEKSMLIERAWAAGFFDGEGSVGVKRGGGVSCSIEQAITGEKESLERDLTGSIKGLLLLERFQNAIGGTGKITNLRHRMRGKEQPTCRWIVTSQIGLTKVWDAIGDFLSQEKRNQFARALGIPAVTAIKHDKPLPEGWASAEVSHRAGGKTSKD